MKRLIYRLLSVFLTLLLLATQVAANNWLINSYRFGAVTCIAGTLTISDLGNGASTTSGATLSTGATITAAVGDMLVAHVGADNQGTSGVPSISGISATGGNTWAVQATINYTLGTAGDGATLGVYTLPVTTALSSATVTVNFSPNTTSKAIEVYKVTPSAGSCVSIVSVDKDGVTTATAGTINPFPASSAFVASGDTVFGMVADEDRGNSAYTYDTDTLNGSWSSGVQRFADSGANIGSMTTVSQYKTVTANSVQSWGVTAVGARDFAATYLVLRGGPVSVAPPTLAFQQCQAGTGGGLTTDSITANFGTADSTRATIVAVMAKDAASVFTFNSMTINGVTANKVVDEGGTNIGSTAIFIAANPTGTSGTVSVTASEAITNEFGFCTWAAYGLNSLQPFATKTDNNASSANLDLSLSTMPNGFVVGACIDTASATTTPTWAGLIEQSEVDIGASNISAAHKTLTLGTPLTIGCDYAGSAIQDSGASAAFGNILGFGVSFISCSAPDSSALTTYTFTAQPSGIPDPNRYTVVGVAADDTASAYTISSATINGITATVAQNGSTTLNGHALLFYAANPSGSTADVSITWSEPITFSRICMWELIIGSSGTPAATNQAFGNPSSTVSLNVPANGVAIGICRAGSSATTSWTGLTKRYEDAISATVPSAADYANDNVADSPLTSVCTCSAGQCPAATASWAP